jgi:nitrogen fixation/metabolism regulation signal transduction histidine kinase
MTFDNSKTIIGVRIKLFIATVLLLAYVALTYVAKLIKFPLLGISDTALTVILVTIWLIIAFLPMILNYQFVFFSDDGEKLVFRYFVSGIVSGKKNSVEINKRTFAGYKAESRFFGLMKSVVLLQHMGQEVAKYPPVYISALSKEQRSKLFISLNKYAPKA